MTTNEPPTWREAQRDEVESRARHREPPAPEVLARWASEDPWNLANVTSTYFWHGDKLYLPDGTLIRTLNRCEVLDLIRNSPSPITVAFQPPPEH